MPTFSGFSTCSNLRPWIVNYQIASNSPLENLVPLASTGPSAPGVPLPQPCKMPKGLNLARIDSRCLAWSSYLVAIMFATRSYVYLLASISRPFFSSSLVSLERYLVKRLMLRRRSLDSVERKLTLTLIRKVLIVPWVDFMEVLRRERPRGA